MEKIIDFIKKRSDLFTFLGLVVICYFIFFFNIGNYALMDVDETRYVSMARDMFNGKDFLTLYLNGEYFFEKPPLYFWGECLSFAIFGKITEFTARFPVALYGTLSVLLVYLTGKRVVSKRYGLISALILATSLEFVILAKFAILDIVVTTCVGFSVMFGFMTQFAEDKNKKYFWWLFYIFSGLAVMAKGIPGFVVPFATMFFVTLYNKTFKEIFKPQYFLVGFLLFFLIVLPWHVVMFKIHNPLFYNEYIVKHHLERFLNSNEIGRKQPFYFYFLTVLWGLFPWIFSAVASGIEKIKSRTKIDWLNNKYLMFNIIGFAVVMLFFSSSSTKLITYILPVYFFTANILGYVWEGYIADKKFEKSINISVFAVGAIFALAAFVACFMKFFLPAQLYSDLSGAKWFSIFAIGIFGILSIYSAYKKNPKAVFSLYVLFMLVISAFGTKLYYNVDYKFGQNDLMSFAKFAKDNGNKIAVINNGRKYSVLYYYGDKVNYVSLNEENPEPDKILFDKDVLTIVKNKDIPEVLEKVNLHVIEAGRKYSLVRVY